MNQGGNVFKAVDDLRIPVLECFAHRLNTAVVWALGLAGPGSTRKNSAMEKIMTRLTALVDVFSYSAVNNDEPTLMQQLEEELSTILELIRRNDTR